MDGGTSNALEGSLSAYTYRTLKPTDRNDVRAIFLECFPLDYPESLYTELVSEKFYSLAACENEEIIGVIIAEIRDYRRLEREDRGFLHHSQYYDNTVYILNLCVTEKHRTKGIASSLLQQLYVEFTRQANARCKAIYLHVLTNNQPAIAFYHKFKFQRYCRIRNFYTVNNLPQDGYLYVLYVNNGQAPVPRENSCLRTLIICLVFGLCSIYACFVLQTMLTSHRVS